MTLMYLVQLAGIALMALCLGDILLYEVTRIALDSPIAIIPTIGFLVFDNTDYTSATGTVLGLLTYVCVAAWEKRQEMEQHIELGTFLMEDEKGFYQEHASFSLKRLANKISNGALFMTDIRIFFVATSEQEATNVTFFEDAAIVFQLALEDVKTVSMQGLTLLITDTNDIQYRFSGPRKKMLYGYEILNGLIRKASENAAGFGGGG